MRQKHTTVQMFCEKHLENISDMFRTLYRDEELADVTLYCREGSVKAHKLILAASSPYFQKIFLENKSENLIIFLHGIGLEELKNLVDLMYRGAADIPVDNVDMMYNYVNELQLTGVLQDESRVPNGETPSRRNSRNRDRDARFRGFKRVATNYSDTNEHYTRSSERLSSSDAGNAPQADTSATENLETEEAEVPRTHDEDLAVAKKLERAMQKSNLWSKKPRKYKCELCDRSFKRASHLTRHQLVHTAHEDIDLYNTIAPEWTGHLQTVDAPRHKLPPPPSQSSGLDDQTINEAQNSEEGSQQPLMDTMYEVPEPPPGEGGECPPPVKKARGRPRKYPKEEPVVNDDAPPQETIKKQRGRPRKYPPVLKAAVAKVRNGGRTSQHQVRNATLDLIKNSEYRHAGSLKDTLRIELERVSKNQVETSKPVKKARRRTAKTKGDGENLNSKENNHQGGPAVKVKRGPKPKDKSKTGQAVPVEKKKRGRKPTRLAGQTATKRRKNPEKTNASQRKENEFDKQPVAPLVIIKGENGSACIKDIKTSKQVRDCKEGAKQEEPDFSSDSHPSQAQQMLEMVFTEGLTPETALMELDSPLADAETGGSQLQLPVKKRRGRPPGSKAQKKKPENTLAKTHTTGTDNQSTIQTSDPLCIENDPMRDSTVIGQDPLVETMLIEPEPQLQPKKKRGRKPREKVPPPLVKRGRGRPRIRPIQPKHDQPAVDSSFVDSNPPAQLKMEHYDFSNLPYGDIEYLTRPLRNKGEVTKLKESAPDERSLHHEVVLEPVVEIKTEPEDRAPTPENISPIVENEIEPPTLEKSPDVCAPPPPPPPSLPPETTLTRVVLPSSSAESQPTTSKATTFEKKVVETTSKLTMFENQIAKIGECTISVANV